MTIRNSNNLDKRCFVYCGDDICDCDAKPSEIEQFELDPDKRDWKYDDFGNKVPKTP